LSYLLLIQQPAEDTGHRGSRRDQLRDREEALHQLAGSVLKPPAEGLATQDTESAESRASYRALPALGILLAHRDDLDEERLNGTEGVELLEAGMATLPALTHEPGGIDAPWYLDSMGLSTTADRPTGAGVLVGVLDTGIDPTHPELDPERIHFAEFSVQGELISTRPRDAQAHGTGVAGLIAGKTMGVAPGAAIAMAAVLTTEVRGKMRGDLPQVLAGLNWLLSYEFRGPEGPLGVDIINASLTLPPDNNGQLYALLNRACVLNGVLMCAAVGNNGINGPGHVGSPASYDIVLGVGATNQAGVVAWFSDWGATTKPDLCAPGVNIPLCTPDQAITSGGRGTSLAAPLVCGVGALLLEQDPDQMEDPNTLRAALLAMATGPATPSPGGNLGGKGSIEF
jgi:subtilisin family serine protease